MLHSRIKTRRSVQATGMTLALLTMLSAQACAPNNRPVIDSELGDYRQMHPIVLARGDRTIDIFVAGGAGALGGRQIADIRNFAQDYRRSAKGPMIIARPANNPEAAIVLPSIRRALAEGGVGSAVVTTYAPVDPTESAPVKLTFAELKAEVATQCGRWPGDLSGLNNFESWKNRPYENFGCASQSALAMQVADPLDLDRPRNMTPPSADRTTTVLTKYNKSLPTAVIYPDEGKGKIDTAVGQ
jgi:pilus assembly protein CpaD